MTVWVHLAVHLVKAISKARENPAASPSPAWRAPRTHATTTTASAEHAAKVLVLDLRREPTKGARDLRLRASGGEAWLVLCDPDPAAAEPSAGHDAVLEVKDRRKGAALLTAIARWLGTKPPLPPYPMNPLRPFALRWSVVGTKGDSERIALRFAWNGRAGELFLDLRGAAPMCVLVEKDPASRADLVAILAVALRDGAPA